MSVDLSIIIVNWNTSELLMQCLESLRRCKIDLANVTVVDNASYDSSVAIVESQFPQVMLIKNNDNLGYAKANNMAIRKSVADYVCLLNSDTIVTPGCLNKMLEFMSGNSEVVACGPALRLPDGKLQTGGAGFELSLGTVFNYFFFLSKLFPNCFKGMYIDQAFFVRKKQPTKVDWLAGACLMVRKHAIDIVGVLDETYFMYAEDAEWCDRLRQVGSIYYLPQLEIIHYHGASSLQGDMVSTTWLDATISYLHAKQSAKIKLFLVIMSIGFMLRAIVYALLGIRDTRYANKAAAMLKFGKYTMSWKHKK